MGVGGRNRPLSIKKEAAILAEISDPKKVWERGRECVTMAQLELETLDIVMVGLAIPSPFPFHLPPCVGVKSKARCPPPTHPHLISNFRPLPLEGDRILHYLFFPGSRDTAEQGETV